MPASSLERSQAFWQQLKRGDGQEGAIDCDRMKFTLTQHLKSWKGNMLPCNTSLKRKHSLLQNDFFCLNENTFFLHVRIFFVSFYVIFISPPPKKKNFCVLPFPPLPTSHPAHNISYSLTNCQTQFGFPSPFFIIIILFALTRPFSTWKGTLSTNL